MKIITLILLLFLSFESFSQEFNKKIVEGVSKLSNTDFEKCVSDTFRTTEISTDIFNSLKPITNIKYFIFDNEFGRYYCNRTFSNRFNTYILCYPPFIDYDIMLLLINCKGDTIYNQIDLSTTSNHELGNSSSYSIFLNDSVFVKYVDYRKRDYVDGVFDEKHWYIGKTITKYLIKSDGTILVIEEKKDERKEKINN